MQALERVNIRRLKFCNCTIVQKKDRVAGGPGVQRYKILARKSKEHHRFPTWELDSFTHATFETTWKASG